MTNENIREQLMSTVNLENIDDDDDFDFDVVNRIIVIYFDKVIKNKKEEKDLKKVVEFLEEGESPSKIFQKLSYDTHRVPSKKGFEKVLREIKKDNNPPDLVEGLNNWIKLFDKLEEYNIDYDKTKIENNYEKYFKLPDSIPESLPDEYITEEVSSMINENECETIFKLMVNSESSLEYNNTFYCDKYDLNKESGFIYLNTEDDKPTIGVHLNEDTDNNYNSKIRVMPVVSEEDVEYIYNFINKFENRLNIETVDYNVDVSILHWELESKNMTPEYLLEYNSTAKGFQYNIVYEPEQCSTLNVNKEEDGLSYTLSFDIPDWRNNEDHTKLHISDTGNGELKEEYDRIKNNYKKFKKYIKEVEEYIEKSQNKSKDELREEGLYPHELNFDK